MFAEAIETIITEQCSSATVRAIEDGASPQPLATAFADTGFYELLAPESGGGGGATWHEFFPVVSLCGAYSLPLPLPQTLAARSLVADIGTLPPGLLTLALQIDDSDGGSLEALHVPFARVATHVLAARGDALVVLPVAGADSTPSGIHGSLTASLRWQRGAGRLIASAVSSEHFHALTALLHAGLLAGAMKRAFDMTMNYANERSQFGKPIGKFQAIQHQLSVMAEHVAAGRIAAEAGFATDGLPPIAACAVAKARTSEAAQLVASIAHAVHGAIGITEEYDLQLSTRRLHEWRLAHGSEVYWHRRIGQLFIESEAPLAADFVRSIFH